MTTPSERRTAGRQSRREEVLAAALTVFRSVGVLSINPTDIGRAAGMTATAIRYHFPTNDDLLDALTGPFLTELETVMATHPTDPPWPEGVESLVTDFVTVVLKHRDTALLIHQDQYLRAHEIFGRRLEIATQQIRRAITGPRPAKADTIAAVAAIGGIWRPIETLAPEEVADHLNEIVSVILSGHPTR